MKAGTEEMHFAFSTFCFVGEAATQYVPRFNVPLADVRQELGIGLPSVPRNLGRKPTCC